MHRHRFSEQWAQAGDPTPAAPTAHGFVQCPLVLMQGQPAASCPWQQVYQLAYEQAQAVVAPSRLERLQRFSPN
jgi:hypothetical protein